MSDQRGAAPFAAPTQPCEVCRGDEITGRNTPDVWGHNGQSSPLASERMGRSGKIGCIASLLVFEQYYPNSSGYELRLSRKNALYRQSDCAPEPTMRSFDLDATDRRILRELQQDGSLR